jgi:hypothetical protein
MMTPRLLDVRVAELVGVRTGKHAQDLVVGHAAEASGVRP